ncbi:hypothetical protein EYC79_08745 [Agrobacterium cavarae]|uniref:Uncharacterized protein n=1 Tax=Agrobacterium cavarae TaxID=2528239 RepID=A0ABY1YBE8_9HYPH|nr:hypothetical protein EYC79_08745 [Agrobacterium cavarae]
MALHDRKVLKAQHYRGAIGPVSTGDAAQTHKHAVFVQERGEVRAPEFESQVFRVSGLKLIASAIIHWNKSIPTVQPHIWSELVEIVLTLKQLFATKCRIFLEGISGFCARSAR